MSKIARHELMTLIGIVLIVCAVALGNTRHNHEIQLNRNMLELHSSAQERDMKQLKWNIEKFNRHLNGDKGDATLSN